MFPFGPKRLQSRKVLVPSYVPVPPSYSKFLELLHSCRQQTSALLQTALMSQPRTQG